MSLNAHQRIKDIGDKYGISVYRPGITQLHYVLSSSQDFIFTCQDLLMIGCYLVTVIANDERELEDHCFKIYYVFSDATENVFVFLEFLISEGQETYPSISEIFPVAEAFEREIADLFGLYPEQDRPRNLNQTYLHNSYPEGLHPLRRNWSHEIYQKYLENTPPVLSIPVGLAQQAPMDGNMILPVGPIHAGVIEPGSFLFRTSGETIEQLDIMLGYTHKGIERLFQSGFGILEGCRLAEKVSGDTSFAHSVAYCKACEKLSRTSIAEEADLIRALFLEIERVANHIGDCAALAHDLALEVPASDLAVLRERVMSLCDNITDSRFLRGTCIPGGIRLPRPLNCDEIISAIRSVVERFLHIANMLIQRSDFRERTIAIGVLSFESAKALGVTGLTARASGLARDFRIQHPFGPYTNPLIQNTIRLGADHTDLIVPRPFPMTGDIFSRFVARAIEVDVSNRLIALFCQQWSGGSQTNFVETLDLRRVPNFETGLGYVEGWRGDIIYWIMKDKFEQIYRCKVRDPSMLNWAGMREAVVSSRLGSHPPSETSLVDFPLINKSFNLSYSGVDL